MLFLPYECISSPTIKPKSWTSFWLDISSPALTSLRNAMAGLLRLGCHASLRASYNKRMVYADWLRPTKTHPWCWQSYSTLGWKIWREGKNGCRISIFRIQTTYNSLSLSAHGLALCPLSGMFSPHFIHLANSYSTLNSRPSISSSVRSFRIPHPKQWIRSFWVPFLYPVQT